jgi:predicted nucleic acid-binding protein
MVVAEAQVLVGLTHIGRLGLTGRLPGYTFVVAPEVLGEIGDSDQRQQIEGAVNGGILQREELSGVAQVALFAELRQLMGTGEAATLALASTRGWAVASDEKKAFRREALARLGQGRILTTPGMFALAIRSGLLSVEDAKANLETLASFRLSASPVLWSDQ